MDNPHRRTVKYIMINERESIKNGVTEKGNQCSDFWMIPSPRESFHSYYLNMPLEHEKIPSIRKA